MATALADYYTAGGKIDWRNRDRHAGYQRLLLPNYPFHRERYWYDLSHSATRSSSHRTTGSHPLLGGRLLSVGANALYETVVEAHSPSYLADHQVQGSVVVPGAAFLEQALAAARQTFGPGNHAVADLSVQAALFPKEEGARLLQVAVEPEAGGRSEMESYSTAVDNTPADAPDWSLHASASLLHESQLSSLVAPAAIDLAAVRSRVIETKTRDEFYQLIADRGLVYGPQFQVLGQVDRTPTEAVATIQAHELVVADLSKYQLHPVLGDACLQTLASTVPLEEEGTYSPYTYMPVAIGQVRIFQSIENLDQPIYCYAVRRSDDDRPSPEVVVSDIYLVDESGEVLVEMLGAKVQRIGRGATSGDAHEPADWLYHIAWHESPLAVSADAQPATGTWLLFADQSGVGNELAKQLAGLGRPVVVVHPGKPGEAACLSESIAPGEVSKSTIDPADETQYAELLAKVSTAASPLAGVVHLWSLDIPQPAIETADSAADTTWQTSTRLGVGSALFVIQQLARCEQTTMPRLWLTTAGAQAVEANAPVAVTQAPLIGLARVAAVEHTELRPTLLDLPSKDLSSKRGTVSHAKALLTELAAHDSSASQPDSQVAYRGTTRLVARLEPDAASRQAIATDQTAGGIPTDSPFQLRITNPGSFDALQYLPVERKAPAAGEVEMAIHATGLNFSDVLKALGLYPGIKDEIVPLGIEASGVVTAVGEGVDRFKVGDQVMGVAPYAFASHATTRDYTLVPKPASIAHDEACTIPITFLTAYYALVRLAQTERGERVLIHAGAGGVGLAAIQICQHLGAEVYATAGSDEKREFLRSIGVKHIYNSRTLDFAEQILADTNREGVDVVLNSLPGEAITKKLVDSPRPWPVPRNRQDRHLSKPQDWPPAVSR